MLKNLFGECHFPSVRRFGTKIEFTVGQNRMVGQSALEAATAYPYDYTVESSGIRRKRIHFCMVHAQTSIGYTSSRERLEAGFILARPAVAKSDPDSAVDCVDAALVVCTSPPLVATTNRICDPQQVTWKTDVPLCYQAGPYMNVSWRGAMVPRFCFFRAAPAQGGQPRLTTFMQCMPNEVLTSVPFRIDSRMDAFGSATVQAPSWRSAAEAGWCVDEPVGG